MIVWRLVGHILKDITVSSPAVERIPVHQYNALEFYERIVQLKGDSPALPPPQNFADWQFTEAAPTATPTDAAVAHLRSQVDDVLRDAQTAVSNFQAAYAPGASELPAIGQALTSPGIVAVQNNAPTRSSIDQGRTASTLGGLETVFEDAMQEGVEAEGSPDTTVTRAALEQLHAAMHAFGAQMAEARAAERGDNDTEVDEAEAADGRDEDTEMGEADATEGGDEVGDGEIDDEQSEVSDDTDLVTLPATVYNPDAPEDSGTIVTLHRLVDQFQWTDADMVSLRQDREEAENVRDLFNTMNGVNMSGNEAIPADMNYQLEDNAEAMVRQAAEYRAQDDDIRMSNADIWRMYDNNDFHVRQNSWCEYCGHLDPNAYHPSIGCDRAPAEADGGESDDDSILLPDPMNNIRHDMDGHIDSYDDDDENDDENLDGQYDDDEDRSEDNDSSIPPEVWNATYEVLDHAAQAVDGQPQDIPHVAHLVMNAWVGLSSAMEEVQAREYTRELQLMLLARMNAVPGFQASGDALLISIEDLMPEAGMDLIGGQWALGW
ncbi:hypothetical protein B0A55_02966, partial [Friedmanniomyces simplex]